MLDPKYIREHLKEIKANCKNRQVKVNVDIWAKLDDQRRELLQEVETLRAERNSIASRMAGTEGDKAAFIARGKELKSLVASKEVSLNEVEGNWLELLRQIPNLTHPDAPLGESDADNVEIRKVGKVKKLKQPLDHVQLAKKHDLIDFERGAKVAGNKFYFLKGKLMILEQALLRYALDHLVREGFMPLSTPDLAKDEILIGTGYQPRGPETQIYSIENSDLSLIGTSEITVGGFHKDEILREEDLPLKYAAFSHCFRTEAGAYGREAYGLYRVHQFSKVEMFVFAAPWQSEALLEEMQRLSEHMFAELGIPFRVVEICTGDFGNPHYRKYDIEAWMWGKGEGQGGWGEVTSASNCTDYQARRLNIRVRQKDGSLVFANTLNNTALATSRAMIAILENCQTAEGTISIPEILVPYCGFDTIE